MSITLTVAPAAHSFVRDPIHARFRCDGYTDASSATSGCTITFTEVAAPGDTLQLVWNGLDLTFLCDVAVDDSGLMYMEPVVATTDETAAMVAEALRNNYYVNRDFVVVQVGSVVALVPYPNSNLPEIDSVVATPGTRATIALTTGGDPYELPANYRVGLRVWVYNVITSAWKVLPETSAAPVVDETDGDPYALHDLHKLLQPFAHTTWPARGYALPTLLDRHTVQWFMEYWEIAGDPVQPGVLARHGSFTAPKRGWVGGLRTTEHLFGTDVLEAFTAGDSTQRFMTWRGRRGKHTVQMAEDHVLGWYCAADGDYSLQARLVNSDDSAVSAWSTRIGSTCDAGEVYAWPTGYDLLTLGGITPPAGIVTRYQVRIVDDGSPVVAMSETYNFHLVNANYQTRYLRWENSLGVVETTHTTGAWEEGLAMSNTEVLQVLGVAPASHEGAYFNIPNGCQGTLKVSTGYLPVGEVRAQADLLNSRQLRIYDAERGREIPCRVTAGEFRLRARGNPADENLYALNLELLLEDPDTEFSDARLFISGEDPR